MQTELVSRWRNEASSLHVVQTADWQSKLHEFGIVDHVDHTVPSVTVTDPAITHKFFGPSTALHLTSSSSNI